METKTKLIDFLHKDLIFVHENYQSSTELFENFSYKAQNLGYVNDSFLPKIVQREATFPTGIALEDYSVAIPHTDPECIEKEFVAIYTLDNPVKFSRMDDPSRQVDVELVFVLGLNQPHTQLEMLQILMGVIQDSSFVKQLIQNDSEQILKAIETFNA